MIPRSYLFVSGDRMERFEKARSSGADAVIVDLEASVSEENKQRARETVASCLSADHPMYVRVNAIPTDWFEEDLEVIDKPGLLGVMLPKAETPEQVNRVADKLADDTEVIALVETALGVCDARALAESPRVTRLAFGSVDFQLDSGIKGEDELGYARTRLVLASRVASISPPLDGVTTAIEDDELLTSDVARAVRQGFGGKLCVHPRQVDTINNGFMPTEKEIAWAESVLDALQKSEAGAFKIDGELVDQPVIERAKRTLALVRSDFSSK